MNKIVVLLVATVMGIASIFTFWASNLMRRTIGRVENVTPEEICHMASFSIYSGRYDKQKETLYLILNNQRSVSLKIEKIYLIYPPNEVKEFDSNEILSGTSLKTIKISGVKDHFSSGIIKTNCPDVFVNFTYSQVV